MHEDDNTNDRQAFCNRETSGTNPVTRRLLTALMNQWLAFVLRFFSMVDDVVCYKAAGDNTGMANKEESHAKGQRNPCFVRSEAQQDVANAVDDVSYARKEK